jgi:predicted AlkP superfamily pyrophosphatase or phosphodiesterase
MFMLANQRCSRRRCRALVLLTAKSVLATGCVSKQGEIDQKRSQLVTGSRCSLTSGYRWNPQKPPKLLLLSLDSLNLDSLNEYIPRLKNPHPSGLSKILKQRNQNAHLIVRDPTITASSHTSTITCSTAGTHGIFANSQWNGQKNVSGFSAPTGVETFATALRTAGLKVVTAGYPSLDNSENGRTVSEGFAYGDNLGKATVVSMSGKESYEHAWKNQKDEILAKINIRRKDNQQFQFECSDGSCTVSSEPSSSVQNLILTLGERRAVAYTIDLKSKQEEIYLSPLGFNKAFPDGTLARLDDCGIVFSPGKDLSLARFGADAIISGLEHRLNFFHRTWRMYLPSTDADAIFAYLEDIDALRHQFAGDTEAQEKVLNHIQKVDQIVGELIQSLPKETNVVIMGDHGMSAVTKELNIRAIVPENALKEAIVYTSGGTLLMYPKTHASDKSNSPASNQWLTQTQEALLKFRLSGLSAPVFEKVLVKGTLGLSAAGLEHPNGPWLIAFANESVGLQNSMSDALVLADTKNPQLPPPRPRGQHGHNSENKTMRAFLTMWGPNLDSLQANQIKYNTDVVPALAKAMNWPSPKQCIGGSK